MAFEIGFTPLGRSSLKGLEKKVQREILNALAPLAKQPDIGKSLVGPLAGLHSLRVRNRYRVVYRINAEAKRVYVELIGERKPGRADDIYDVARRLLESLRG